MHAGRHYSLKEILLWTRRETVAFVALGAIPVAFDALGLKVAFVPWTPIAVLGTAVAFLTGFKSNSAYGRLWEARQIWGAIVNASRTWAVSVRDFVDEQQGSDEHRRLVIRQVAWLTALRFQLREPRAWETLALDYAAEYQSRTYVVPERVAKLEDELRALLPAAEVDAVLAKKNRASALLAIQSDDLRRATREGRLTEWRHVELMRQVANLIDQQGKCERIKNFPYPRQFATLNRLFVWLFLVLLPFGIASEFERVCPGSMGFALPVTVIIAWVFHTMDKIGEASSNPFEGGPNDVPISTMSRGIEIDLRDLLGDSSLPSPLAPVGSIAM